MPRGRDPWVAVDATIRKNRKMTDLPSDTARWGWIAVLGEAKLQRPAGWFASRCHAQEALGRFGRYLEDYVDVGLLEPASHLCPACRGHFPELPKDALLVHDWWRHQRDPETKGVVFNDPAGPVPGFERTRWWRLRRAVFERDHFICRYCGRPEYERKWLVVDHVVPVQEGRDDTMDNLATSCRSCNGKKGGRRPEEAGMRLLPLTGDASPVRHGDDTVTEGDVRHGDDMRHVTSRARAATATVTDTENESVSSNVGIRALAAERPPKTNGASGWSKAADVAAELVDAAEDGPEAFHRALSRRDLEAWATFGPEWDALKAAWIGRGLRHPPSGAIDEDGSQRQLLFEILDAWPTRIVEWVQEAPPKAAAKAVIAHVIARRDQVRGEQLDQAEDRELDWQAVKATDRDRAPEAVARLASA